MHVLCFVVALLVGHASLAAQELALEFPERPVVNSSRVIGLGGAYVGVAEGADGHLFNPAAFASRFSYTRDLLFDWDWTVYWLNLVKHRHPDIATTDADSIYAGAGIDLKVWRFGVGVHLFVSGYDFGLDSAEQVSLAEGFLALALAYAVPYIDLSIGGSLLLSSSTITVDDEQLLSTSGRGLKLGVLWAPTGRPFRIGATLRNPIIKDADSVVLEGDDRVLPTSVEEPARIVLGASYMFGGRKYNPKATYGSNIEGEPTSWGRRYILVACDVVYTFATSRDAMSINGFLSQSLERSGEEGALSMRFGVESEVVSNWLRLRTGYYPETSRIKGNSGRHHWTVGADLKIPVIWDWRFNVALDVSSGYLNYGLGLGFWH